MDFVSGLPDSNGFDTILVIVDCLSKLQHLILCHTTINGEQTAQLYLHHVWKLHDLPTHITSDRGTQFTAKFWKSLGQQLKIEARMWTAHHTESDGQTERLNAVMEQYLCCYVCYQRDNWADWLPTANFAANTEVSATTRATSFFVNYGYHTRLNNSILLTDNSPQALDSQQFA